MEDRKKESVFVSLVAVCVGCIGIVLSFVLYFNWLYNALILGIAISCIALFMGVLFFVLAWTGKWTRGTETVKQKRNGLIVFAIIAIGFSIVIVVLFTIWLGSSSSMYGMIVVISLYPMLNWGYVFFYVWSYIRERKKERLKKS